MVPLWEVELDNGWLMVEPREVQSELSEAFEQGCGTHRPEITFTHLV